ncbi:MAG: guanylate kinase [Anaerolineae bacterium]|nr:guanylate kinase [Anaerolineae bacterium]
MYELQERDAEQLYHFECSPLLIVISGTSGAGKDSVIKALSARMETEGRPFHFVVTANTRPRREDEVDGVDYHFVSVKEFERMIAQDELLEYAVVYDQYKGVPKKQVHEAMASGKDVVMRLDVQGAATIRKIAPPAVLIFITTSSEQELIDRLCRRRTEAEEQLDVRVQTAREEMSRIHEFDYVVPNCDGRLSDAVDIIVSIITAEKHRAIPRQAKL